MAHIFSIVYQPLDQPYKKRTNFFIRVPTEQATLVAGHGIEGDRKAGRNVTRQLNLLSREWLAERQSQGFKTEPGDFGEQLIIEGLAVEELAAGTRLQLGDEACIELSKPRTGCERLDAVQGVPIELAGGNIGMLARVITGGTIRVGDTVQVFPKAPAKQEGPR